MQSEPLAIAEITVPDDRFGEHRGDDKDETLVDLAASISRHGVLNPVTLTEDNVLIAGARRLAACQLLDRTELRPDEYKYKEDLSEADRREIELVENILRNQLDWAEESRGIAEIHRLKMEEDEEWNYERTAALVGRSKSTVYNSLNIDKELDENPDLEEKSTLTGALREIKEKREMEERKRIVERKKKGRGPSLRADVFQGDARELISEMPDECVDAIITNPPFGVDLALKEAGREPQSVYEDEENYISDLLRIMAHEMYRVLKDKTWLVSFFDIRKITYSNHVDELSEAVLRLTSNGALDAHIPPEGVKELRATALRSRGLAGWLEDAGFDYVQVVPCIWAKPNKTQGLIGDPSKGMITAYEAMIFAAKGDAKLQIKGRNNLFIMDSPPSSERVHPLQMPVKLAKYLCDYTVIGGELVLDPFCGSGAIGLGALERQCEFIGFELNPEFAERAQMLLDEHVYSESEGEE